MRIVHQINCPMIGSVGGRPYHLMLGKQGFNDLQIEGLITSDLSTNHPELHPAIFSDEDPEVIYFEGSAKYIAEAFEQIASQIRYLIEHYKNEMGEVRPSNCPDCKPEDIQPNVSHLTTCPMHSNYEYFKNIEFGALSE